MNTFAIIALISVGLSFLLDRKKTIQSLSKGLAMFVGIVPAILYILVAISTLLWLFPKEAIAAFLNQGSGLISFIFAGLVGSIAMIPGFIAYPLAGVLHKSGVSYQILAVFLTTLLMVGVVSLPLEAKYFGWRAALMRNLLSFIAAFIIGFLMRLFL
jgi:uncharacterized membrane protein YraQ (UPF0718 family)